MYFLKTDVVNDDNNEIIPQVTGMGPVYDFDAPDSLTRITPNAPLAHPPNLHAFQLDPETMLTDVVSQGYVFTNGLLISEALTQVLDGRVIQRHELYPADVVFRGETYRYFWIHFTEELEERIDYAHSEFVVEPLDGGPGRPIELRSRAELHARVVELVDTMSGELKARRIAFLPRVPPLELFSVQLTKRTFFASDELADRLEAEGLTGFELQRAAVEILFSTDR